MKSYVEIRVPATTANLGPGFDCLGMALDIWNTVRLETGGSGINITGETGHDITLSVDGVPTTVTHAFVNDGGDYRTGTLEFQVPALEPGQYLVNLKAWDNFNNSATR